MYVCMYGPPRSAPQASGAAEAALEDTRAECDQMEASAAEQATLQERQLARAASQLHDEHDAAALLGAGWREAEAQAASSPL